MSPKYPRIDRIYAATLDQNIRKNHAAADVLLPDPSGRTSMPRGFPISTSLAAEYRIQLTAVSAARTCHFSDLKNAHMKITTVVAMAQIEPRYSCSEYFVRAFETTSPSTMMVSPEIDRSHRSGNI